MLALAFDPCRILHAQGITADPWQRELLLSTAPRILLNCCRGAGKSREAAGSGDPRRARAPAKRRGQETRAERVLYQEVHGSAFWYLALGAGLLTPPLHPT